MGDTVRRRIVRRIELHFGPCFRLYFRSSIPIMTRVVLTKIVDVPRSTVALAYTINFGVVVARSNSIDSVRKRSVDEVVYDLVAICCDAERDNLERSVGVSTLPTPRLLVADRECTGKLVGVLGD